MSLASRMDPLGDLIGTQLGSYRIEGPLGRGSMASVFRARDVLTRQEVALKVHARKENEASRRRFLQEARATARLKHPGIVETYEAGAEGELSFIAMELVVGAPLTAVLAGGALPWREALHLTWGIASALGHAHAAGVMHRDLKPSNVLLTHDGRVKLVDFGLAKRVGDVPDVGDGATVWDWADVHTQPGAVLGTPAYMAPEQARAVHVDARADVFALGVLTWEAIVGRPLFRRATPAATLRAILIESAPDLSGLAEEPDLPAWLSELVARALAKDPDDRFQDARELLTTIKESQIALPIPYQALSRIEERRSMVLSEPPFTGRARELRQATARLENERGAIVVGMPGAGRKRLAIQALSQLGATRSLVLRFTDPSSVAIAFAERPYDSVILDAGSTPGDEVFDRAREALGERARLAVIADRVDQAGDRVVRVDGLAPDEAAELLAPGAMGQSTEQHGAREITQCLTDIALGVGGHPQSLLTIALRLSSEPVGDVAAALELDDGWPEILAAQRTLARWIEERVSALPEATASALLALSVVPSLSEADALELTGQNAVAILAELLSSPLLTPESHPDLLGVRRVAVPALVRRKLTALAQSPVHVESVQAARAHLMAQLAERASELSLLARTDPERETLRELGAERATLLALAHHTLGHADVRATEARSSAALALVALVESELLLPPKSDARSSADHLLARVLTQGGLDAALTLRASAARSAFRLERASGASTGVDEALALAQQLGDRGTEARMLLARAARHHEVSSEPTAAMRSDLEAALECLTQDTAPWLKQEVLEHVGELRWSLGEAAPARGALRNAHAQAEERGDQVSQGRLTHRLARLALAELETSHDDGGALVAITNEETSALELALATGNRRLAGRIENALAELAILRGEPEAARRHVDRAIRHGAAALPRAALCAGHLELLDRNWPRARALYAAAVGYAETQEDEPAIAVAHAALAAALAASGDRPNANDALVRATLAARRQPEGLRLVVAGWRGHLERAFVERDLAVDGSSDESRLLRASERFDQAGLLAGLSCEAGTGRPISAYLLDHAG
jgi:serine/threonine protein kinase